MEDELATSNVNRSYSLAGTSIAIFTFMLIFLYPRFASGEIDALLFQVADSRSNCNNPSQRER